MSSKLEETKVILDILDSISELDTRYCQHLYNCHCGEDEPSETPSDTNEDYECCVTCKNRLSKTYATIRCGVWTEDVRDHLIYEGGDPEHIVGRVSKNMRCQHYTKL